jgi:hypothetical protein
MHPSIGMETRAASTRWDDVRRGPSKAEVRAHVQKLANYPALMAEAAAERQQAETAEAIRLAA